MAFRAVVAFTTNTVKTGHAVQAKAVSVTCGAFFSAIFTAKGAVRAAFTAIAYPVRTFDAYIAVRAISGISDAIGALFTFAADPVGTSRAFLAAIHTYRFAHLVAAAAFIFTLTVILKAVAAVIAQLVVVIAGAAIAAVMFLIAAGAASFAAVVAVFAFPVVIAPAAAVIAFYAVFIIGVSRHRNTVKNGLDDIFADCKKINMLIMRGVPCIFFMSAVFSVIVTVMIVVFFVHAVRIMFRIKVEMLKCRCVRS